MLSVVHAVLEEPSPTRFVLTGSSARKLRRGDVNLLGGRALHQTLHPFMAAELPDFDLDRSLRRGLVPLIVDASAPERTLDAYASLYIDQEVRAAGLRVDRHLQTGPLWTRTKVGSDPEPQRENTMRALLTLALFATVSACDAPPPDATADEEDGPLQVSVLEDGTILLDDEEMTPGELTEALEDIEATRVVAVKVDPDVAYGKVNEVQQALTEAGVKRVLVEDELE